MPGTSWPQKQNSTTPHGEFAHHFNCLRGGYRVVLVGSCLFRVPHPWWVRGYAYRCWLFSAGICACFCLAAACSLFLSWRRCCFCGARLAGVLWVGACVCWDIREGIGWVCGRCGAVWMRSGGDGYNCGGGGVQPYIALRAHPVHR
jgi:hypothetical protein